MMTDKEKRDILINDIIIPSLQDLYRVDYKNIFFNVSERNICARLAHHMENRMRQYDGKRGYGLFGSYFADVEYDRMADGKLKYYENTLHRPQQMISDLLIHSRGVLRNLLAVEMKRKKNYNKRREDRERLMAVVSTKPKDSEMHCVYDTLVGAFIIYAHNSVKIELYENVDGTGRKSEVIYLNYNATEGLSLT